VRWDATKTHKRENGNRKKTDVESWKQTANQLLAENHGGGTHLVERRHLASVRKKKLIMGRFTCTEEGREKRLQNEDNFRQGLVQIGPAVLGKDIGTDTGPLRDRSR